MPKLIKHREATDDHWTLVKEASDGTILAALPNRDLIVPLHMWKLYRRELDEHGGQIAVWLDSHENINELAHDLDDLPLVALNFPVFSDGRSYTNARELRETLGYQGEVRAIGDVLRDQLYYMHRCGFDAFAPRFDQDLDSCLTAFDDFKTGYQVSVDQPLPLFRRRAAG